MSEQKEMVREQENGTPQIRIRDMSVSFQDNKGKEVKALTHVNLDISKSEFVSLVGPSGCGKTTLLRTMADLQEPTEGTVRIDGMTPKEVRLQQRFGIVFQSPVLFEWRTVRENVELPLEIKRFGKEKRREEADKMLEMVGLQDFAGHYPGQLSGGMQQRVNIARALALRPEILLMDEPFSALDEFTKEKLHEDLLRIWRKTEKTIVFVTHNIAEAVFLSDKVCVMSPHPGRLSSVVEIDIPRPRGLEVKDTLHFTELVAGVRNCFEGGSV
nr:ABC transporter ATP-binding protein [uncultured Eisenbergiella sp.]